jgi:hypothetical protein
VSISSCSPCLRGWTGFGQREFKARSCARKYLATKLGQTKNDSISNLHKPPRIHDSWPYLYLEHCRIDQD